MRLLYRKTALKALQRFDAATRGRILGRIAGLRKEPPEGDIKPLVGRPGLYRLRVGDYRVVFQSVDSGIDILDIGSRGDVYK